VVRALLLLSAAFLSLHAAASDAWPGQRGDERCRASERIDPPGPPLTEWHFRGRGDRRYEQGVAVWASPALAIVEGKPMAFLGGCDQTLHALDLASQKQIWSKVCNGIISDAPVIGEVKGRQVVYWGSSDRTVYAHDAGTGERVWTRELIPPTSTLGEPWMPSPLLMDHVLYVACFAFDKALARNEQNARLCALDPETGDLKWKITVGQGPLNAPAGCRIDGRNHVFVAARKGLLRAFDVSGPVPVERWSFQMPHEVMASPAVDARSEPPALFLGSKFGDLMAIDARAGKRLWHRMTGNWIDNNACVGSVEGRSVVYVGSHDYCVYALDSANGGVLWKRPLGGEVYSAPCFFQFENRPAVAFASMDNRLTVLDAATGSVTAAFFTGEPVWDKVSKGETLWGSPAAFEEGARATLVHGSSSGSVYSLPLSGPNSLRAQVRTTGGLWVGIGVCFLVFVCILLPAAWFWPGMGGRFSARLLFCLVLSGVPAVVRAGESAFSLTPAPPEVFETYREGAPAPLPPKGVTVLGRLDSPSFSIGDISQVAARLPSGKTVPLMVDERRILREFGKIVSLDFWFALPDVSGASEPVVLRWGTDISAGNKLVPGISCDVSQSARYRILSPISSSPDAEASASVGVIADTKASFIPLWYLLPMVLVFALLTLRKLGT